MYKVYHTLQDRGQHAPITQILDFDPKLTRQRQNGIEGESFNIAALTNKLMWERDDDDGAKEGRTTGLLDSCKSELATKENIGNAVSGVEGRVRQKKKATCTKGRKEKNRKGNMRTREKETLLPQIPMGSTSKTR